MADPRGVWDTMGTVRVEGPGLEYLRSCGFTQADHTTLRVRCGFDCRLDAELEGCGVYWQRIEPKGLSYVHAAIAKWLARSKVDLGAQSKAVRKAHRERAHAARQQIELDYERAEASRAGTVARENRKRRQRDQDRADAAWNAKNTARR